MPKNVGTSTIFKRRQILLQKKKRELSEYKVLRMIQNHLFLIFQATQKNTQAITKIFIRLFPTKEKQPKIS